LSCTAGRLEKPLALRTVVDFELFRSVLGAALARSDRSRPPFGPVLMFKVLVLQAL